MKDSQGNEINIDDLIVAIHHHSFRFGIVTGYNKKISFKELSGHNTNAFSSDVLKITPNSLSSDNRARYEKLILKQQVET